MVWQRTGRLRAGSHEQHDQIQDEQQYDGRFEDQHPAVDLVLLVQAVEAVQRILFASHDPVPVAEVESLGQQLVNPGQVPVTEELRDI